MVARLHLLSQDNSAALLQVQIALLLLPVPTFPTVHFCITQGAHLGLCGGLEEGTSGGMGGRPEGGMCVVCAERWFTLLHSRHGMVKQLYSKFKGKCVGRFCGLLIVSFPCWDAPCGWSKRLEQPAPLRNPEGPHGGAAGLPLGTQQRAHRTSSASHCLPEVPGRVRKQLRWH